MNKIKRIIGIMVMVMVFFTMMVVPCSAKSKSNEQIAKDYILYRGMVIIQNMTLEIGRLPMSRWAEESR